MVKKNVLVVWPQNSEIKIEKVIKINGVVKKTVFISLIF